MSKCNSWDKVYWNRDAKGGASIKGTYGVECYRGKGIFHNNYAGIGAGYPKYYVWWAVGGGHQKFYHSVKEARADINRHLGSGTMPKINQHQQIREAYKVRTGVEIIPEEKVIPTVQSSGIVSQKKISDAGTINTESGYVANASIPKKGSLAFAVIAAIGILFAVVIGGRVK